MVKKSPSNWGFEPALLMGCVIQVLWSVAMLCGGIPLADSEWGKTSLCLSAILWMLSLSVGWSDANKTDLPTIIMVSFVTLLGAMAVITPLIYIPVIAQVGYGVNTALWAVMVLCAIQDILK